MLGFASIIMILMIANNVCQSHWLQRINPLRLFNRKQIRLDSHRSYGTSPNNNSNSSNETTIHFGLQVRNTMIQSLPILQC